MPQEPNIDISKIESIKELPMPVPRRTEARPAENIKPNSDEVFGNTGPDTVSYTHLTLPTSDLV